MIALLSVPCTGPMRPAHRFMPEGTDAAGRAIESCLHCDGLFRMLDGGARALASDLMEPTVAPVALPARFRSLPRSEP